MKDYRLDKTENKDDILDYICNEDGTVTVKFADGRVFEGLLNSDEQIAKIIARQEEQVERGIENIPAIEQRKKKNGIYAGIALATTGVIAASTIPVLNLDPNPATMTIAGVTVALLGAVPAYKYILKDLPVLRELKKLQYRNENQSTLEKISQYPNSLAGLSQKKADRITEDTDPFSISNVDEFSQKDLETIVGNIEREESCNFQYVKRSKSK